MALTKRTRFILVQSTNNANVTEDNMEPYHISIFRRSTSMPPLPKLSSINLIRREEHEQEFSFSPIRISKYQRREKNEVLTNKFNKLNIHAMKRKSARISRRLSSAFGLTAQTIDEQFNFHEQRFRAIEKFLKLFLRNSYICIEALRESFLTQINVAEDFEALLIDKMPDLPQQFVRSKRSLLENAFTEFCSHIELNVVHSINTLIKLFILPSNLISKRHKKLLDYDNAQSAYEKVKDQQLKQAKQVLDLSKQTYEILNNQLLEELPILYESSYQILSLCLTEFLRAHFRLIQQMRNNIRVILNQTISPAILEQLNWQQIVERFTAKNNSVTEQFFQLTITGKNFTERLKNLSTIQRSNLYNYDKEIYIQTNEIRYLIKNRYLEKDIFTVIQDYTTYSDNRSINSRLEITVRSGDLVGIINQHSGDNTDLNWFVDNGVTRGYVPRSILVPLSSNNQSDLSTSTPPTPIRHDISVPSRAPLPLPRTKTRSNYDQPRDSLTTANIEPCLINSSHDLAEANERIYLNQPSVTEATESHQYASIDLDTSASIDRIYIALYDFNSTMDGVLSLHVGERLKILRHVDDDDNEEWWYVEKMNNTKQKGYVPANYIQAIEENV